MNLFFTSDHHFFHAAILNLRPQFSSVDEMNEALVERWNSVVTHRDCVYHLGDISFGTEAQACGIVTRLRGRKFLLLGNHDRHFERTKNQHLFEWVRDYHYLRLTDLRISMSHYAFRTWRNARHGAWHLFGHSHGSLTDDGKGRTLDVGVDCWDFRPVSLEELRENMKTREFVPVDHHGRGPKWATLDT